MGVCVDDRAGVMDGQALVSESLHAVVVGVGWQALRNRVSRQKTTTSPARTEESRSMAVPSVPSGCSQSATSDSARMASRSRVPPRPRTCSGLRESR